jgi:hypothetical protein
LQDIPKTARRHGIKPRSIARKRDVGQHSYRSRIYLRTLKAMNISLEWLKPTDCSFHGIVPGSANHPLGKIKLNVCFGDSGNFRREKLEFEVTD